MSAALDLIAKEFASGDADKETEAKGKSAKSKDCECEGQTKKKAASKKTSRKKAPAKKAPAKKSARKKAPAKKRTSKRGGSRASTKPAASKAVKGSDAQIVVPKTQAGTAKGAFSRAKKYVKERYGEVIMRGDYSAKQTKDGFTFTRVSSVRRLFGGKGKQRGDLIHSPHTQVVVTHIQTTGGEARGKLIATPLATGKSADGAKSTEKGDLYRITGLKAATGSFRNTEWQKVKRLTISGENAGSLYNAVTSGRLRFRWTGGSEGTLAYI